MKTVLIKNYNYVAEKIYTRKDLLIAKKDNVKNKIKIFIDYQNKFDELINRYI